MILKLSIFLISIFTLLINLQSLIITQSFARTTPADILNAQRQTYQKKVSQYSLSNQQLLEGFSKKIADLSKQKTDDLNLNLERQGQILEEHIRRNNIKEKKVTDGVNRNLSNEVENARYWLTFAHEAVAFQAAKIYIFNLTSEGNIKNDVLSSINSFEYDLNTLRGKLIKSQNIIKTLITK